LDVYIKKKFNSSINELIERAKTWIEFC
jgi:hypothetical protein